MVLNPDVLEVLEANGASESPSHRVLREVAAIHGVTVHAMRGARRLAPLPAARRAACVELRALGLSMPAIGRELGGMHHTTVLYHLRKAAA